MTDLCKDIVHVDTVAHRPNAMKRSKRVMQGKRSDNHSKTMRGDKHVLEIFASTKPYCDRRSSSRDDETAENGQKMGEKVLERNICFVDTCDSTFGGRSADSGKSFPIMDYIMSSFRNAVSVVGDLPKEMLERKLSNRRAQVDLVLFIFNHGKNLYKPAKGVG